MMADWAQRENGHTSWTHEYGCDGPHAQGGLPIYPRQHMAISEQGRTWFRISLLTVPEGAAIHMMSYILAKRKILAIRWLISTDHKHNKTRMTSKVSGTERSVSGTQSSTSGVFL